MPPRRPPRRGKRQSAPGTPALSQVALKDVRRAHKLFERGEHSNAAQLFEQQARDAADRGIFLPAAHLYLQAGRTRMLSGDIFSSEQLMRDGLRLLADRTDPDRLALSAIQLGTDLRGLGQGELETKLLTWVENEYKLDIQEIIRSKKISPVQQRVPPRCSSCSAYLRSADIESLDTGQEVCVYCGSLIDWE